MQTIYKYPLSITDQQTLTMPRGARVLDVQAQPNSPTGLVLWAVVDTDEPPRPRTFLVFGTGNNADALGEGATSLHVATVQMFGGDLVWHIFERLVHP